MVDGYRSLFRPDSNVNGDTRLVLEKVLPRNLQVLISSVLRVSGANFELKNRNCAN